jgi:hypothetical protein
MAALFIGASNADRLANSAATLGIVTETITAGGGSSLLMLSPRSYL